MTVAAGPGSDPPPGCADILCIGCQRGGTGWLHAVLGVHPDVRPPAPVQPDAPAVASGGPVGRRLLVAPDLACLPADRIADWHRANPQARVVYVLRDPLARAASALGAALRDAVAGARLDATGPGPALEAAMAAAGLDAHGDYLRNLRAWTRHFPDLLVLSHEDLHADPARWVARLMAHARLDPSRMTGADRARQATLMAARIGAGAPVRLDRDVLLYLAGHTARTRTALRDRLGLEFREGARLLAAAVPAAPVSSGPPPDPDTMSRTAPDLTRLAAAAEAQSQALSVLRAEVQQQRRLTQLLLDHSAGPLLDEVEVTLGSVVMGMAETLAHIAAQRVSLARFGDGEFMLMARPGHALAFQPNSPALRADLRRALNPDWLAPGRVLVALPPAQRANAQWQGTWVAAWPILKPLIDPARRYGHAMVSRPMLFRDQGAAGVALWRRLWDGRQVLVVTGKGSRFDLLPALFDGAAAVDLLLTESVDAYRVAVPLLAQILRRARPDGLVLLSLGPTAGILAHRLAAEGVQALDIGHLSASWAHVFANAPRPEALRARRPAPPPSLSAPG